MPKTRVVNKIHFVPSKAGKLVQVLTRRINKAVNKVGTTSKATSANPKDIIGAERVSLTKIPPIALIHMADAMMDGAGKYDPYNWRAKDITLHGYVDAALRHILDFWEGEDCAPDSLAKHLGHGMATLAIILDAQAHGCLIDDRPKSDGGKAIAEAMAIVKANEAYRKAKRACKQAVHNAVVHQINEQIDAKGARSGRCSGKKRNAAGTAKRKKS